MILTPPQGTITKRQQVESEITEHAARIYNAESRSSVVTSYVLGYMDCWDKIFDEWGEPLDGDA